jgi:hypothetical protein
MFYLYQDYFTLKCIDSVVLFEKVFFKKVSATFSVSAVVQM